MSWSYCIQRVQLRWEVIVGFDIGGIDDYTVIIIEYCMLLKLSDIIKLPVKTELISSLRIGSEVRANCVENRVCLLPWM